MRSALVTTQTMATATAETAGLATNKEREDGDVGIGFKT
jgi:hypothetical protein